MNKILLVCLIFLPNCASLKDAGANYFKSDKKYAGVESPDLILENTERYPKIRNIIYASINTNQVIRCTLLRNQIYVASLSSLGKGDKQELKEVAQVLEQAYQQDDQAFLTACAQVLKTRVGRLFKEIQDIYFR